ncbi:hypothetical protein AO356_01070 [Pseudomonas fluorescens]|uniref:Uncharacterized protein n=1 Tax=Pseudomonas fluorescens TaxID=294 RepID=A0A0N9WCP3_PSEFL|nr:hypothetical protein AO356_01070 [Pseudomonas fluorescens]
MWLENRANRFWGGFATQREQAPSPQKPGLQGSRRHIALGIQQLIELSGQLANRALDDVEARPST